MEAPEMCTKGHPKGIMLVHRRELDETDFDMLLDYWLMLSFFAKLKLKKE